MGAFAGLVDRETGRSALSSATLIFGVRARSKAIANGFGAPFGVEENTSPNGCNRQSISSQWPGGSPAITPGMLTTRTSPGFAFRAVLGVLPRSFPGVLKSSTTFLTRVRFCHGRWRKTRTFGSRRRSQPCARSASPSRCAPRKRTPQSLTRPCGWPSSAPPQPMRQSRPREAVLVASPS